MKGRGAVMIRGAEMTEVTPFTARGPLVCPADFLLMIVSTY